MGLGNASQTVRRLGAALFLACALLAVSPRPAAAASTLLCTGYSGCGTGGYTTHGYQAHSQTSFWNMVAGNECTNYVAFVESTAYRVASPSYLLGNGGDWAVNARAHGVVVNNVPSVGAVAEWNGGDYGMGPLGHVAVVERIGPNDSYIVISQQHMAGIADGYDWTQIDAGGSRTSWQEWPDNFIHFASPAELDVQLAVGFDADRRPELFAIDSAGALVHDAWTGSSWSGWLALAPSPVFTGIPYVIRNRSGTLEVFALVAGGGVDHLWQLAPNGVGGWSVASPVGSLSLNGLTSVSSALVWPDGHAEVFATVAGTGSVIHAYRLPGGAWSGWSSLGGPVIAPLASGMNADGRPELFGTSPNGFLVHDWWTGSRWSGWQGLAAGLVSGSPAVLANRDGTLEVFVRTPAGTLDHAWQRSPNGAGGWSALDQIGAAAGLTGDPAAVLWLDGHAEVFATDASGTVLHAYREPSGAWSALLSLGGSATGRVAAWVWPATTSDPEGHAEVAARVAGGAIAHSWWTPAGWSRWASFGGAFG